MASKRAILATSIILIIGEACVPLLSMVKADTFPVDSKLPDTQIIKASGLGTEAAYIEAKTTVEDIKAWCDNWIQARRTACPTTLAIWTLFIRPRLTATPEP